MSFNIVDLVKDQLSDQLLGQIGGVLGGDASTSASAISAAIPGLLSGLTGAGSSTSGAKGLLDTINQQDDSILDNFGDMFSGDKQSSMISSGTSALTSTLGEGNLGNLTNAISGFSGASKGGIASMLGMFAPMILGLLKRKLLGSSDGLNAGGLMNLLNGQKENIDAAMPSGFAEKLHFSGVTDKAEKTVERVQEAVYAEEEKTGGSFLGKLLPLALLAGAGYFAYTTYMKQATSNTEVEHTTTSTQVEETAVQTPESSTTDGSIESLGQNITDTMGALQRSFSAIADEDSAKGALDDITVATEKMGDYAGMLDKLPQGGKANIINLVTTQMPQIENAINKVGTIPGVGGVLRPIVTTLLGNLAKFK